MEIQFKKVLWNEHEAALLIEVYEKVQNGIVSRDQAISQLSKRLRNRMILDRIAINDKYRNFAGMDLQLNTIERYVRNGKDGWNNSISKVFEKMILLKKENKASFDNILEEANLLYPEVAEPIEYKTRENETENENEAVAESKIYGYATCKSTFDWNKFEAALLVNLYKQITNDILQKDEACMFVEKRFRNSSPLVDRKVIASSNDLTDALSDIEQYEKGKLHDINQELETAFEMSNDNEMQFREQLDTATKLYPLERISTYLQSSTTKENITSTSYTRTKEGNAVKQSKEEVPATPINTNTEIIKIAPSNEYGTCGELNAFIKKARNSFLVAQFASQRNINTISIDHFYTLKGYVYHVVPFKSFNGLTVKPILYNIISARNKNRFVIWKADISKCLDEDIFDLLCESYAYKEANDIQSLPQESEIELNRTSEKVKRIYQIPDESKIKTIGVKLLTLRARRCIKAVNFANSNGVSKIIPHKTVYSINGKACHVVPLEEFSAKSGSSKYQIVENEYGVKFASWLIDASEFLSDNEVVEILRESIIFNSLKPKSGTAPKDGIVEKKFSQQEQPTIKSGNIPSITKKKEPNAQIKTVLMDKFKMGYRMDSNMDRKRFANFYFSTYNEELDLDGVALDREISQCGVIYKDKVYVPDVMLTQETQNKLFEFINKQFENNIQCIYYNVLFKGFSDRFLGQKILDEYMLKTYLEYFDDKGIYNFGTQYFSKGVNAKIDVNTEVVNFIKEQGRNVSEEEVVSALPYLPKDDILEAFSSNKQTLLCSGRKTRFHIANFQLEKDDKKAIIDYLSQEIIVMKFVSFVELFDKMRIVAPRVIDNNFQFSETGIRSALSCLLCDYFYFRGGIISDLRNPICLKDAYIDFARGRKSFSVDEVQTMADDFKTPINFEALVVHNVRVSEELYVDSLCVFFDQEAIDNAIAMFCKGDFISITDINTFVVFPECGYQWNLYLLESYLYSYSKQFKLLHNRFNKSSVSGAIIRRGSHFDDYNEILAKALANAGVKLEKKSVVLDYLSENGFIGRRQLDSIEVVISRAKQLKMN